MAVHLLKKTGNLRQVSGASACSVSCPLESLVSALRCFQKGLLGVAGHIGGVYCAKNGVLGVEFAVDEEESGKCAGNLEKS